MALYTADEEADGQVRCIDACTSFCEPLERLATPLQRRPGCRRARRRSSDPTAPNRSRPMGDCCTRSSRTPRATSPAMASPTTSATSTSPGTPSSPRARRATPDRTHMLPATATARGYGSGMTQRSAWRPPRRYDEVCGLRRTKRSSRGTCRVTPTWPRCSSIGSNRRRSDLALAITRRPCRRRRGGPGRRRAGLALRGRATTRGGSVPALAPRIVRNVALDRLRVLSRRRELPVERSPAGLDHEYVADLADVAG